MKACLATSGENPSSVLMVLMALVICGFELGGSDGGLFDRGKVWRCRVVTEAVRVRMSSRMRKGGIESI